MDGIWIDLEDDVCKRIAGIAEFVCMHLEWESDWRKYWPDWWHIWRNFKGVVLEEGTSNYLVSEKGRYELPKRQVTPLDNALVYSVIDAFYRIDGLREYRR